MAQPFLAPESRANIFTQKTSAGRVRAKFAQNEGHEKATKGSLNVRRITATPHRDTFCHLYHDAFAEVCPSLDRLGAVYAPSTCMTYASHLYHDAPTEASGSGVSGTLPLIGTHFMAQPGNIFAGFGLFCARILQSGLGDWDTAGGGSRTY